MNTTRQDSKYDPAYVISVYALEARYSATVTTPAALRQRILRRARQARLTAAWGLRSSIGTRSAS